MIKLLAPIPRQTWVACSGGVDSMAAVDFLRRNHDVSVAYFNHGTAHGEESQQWLERYCACEGLKLTVGQLRATKPSKQSVEEFWRNQRYQFFKSLPGTVVTAHHLDDCVETYLFNCLHGKSHTIAIGHANVIRPFLLTPKTDLESWCVRKGVPWIDDPSNGDLSFMRNLIRHSIVPEALKINPGLHKVVKKMVIRSVMEEF